MIMNIIMNAARKNSVPCPRFPIFEVSTLIPAAVITFIQKEISASSPNVIFIPNVGINAISMIIVTDAHFGNLYEIEANIAPKAASAE